MRLHTVLPVASVAALCLLSHGRSEVADTATVKGQGTNPTNLRPLADTATAKPALHGALAKKRQDKLERRLQHNLGHGGKRAKRSATQKPAAHSKGPLGKRRMAARKPRIHRTPHKLFGRALSEAKYEKTTFIPGQRLVSILPVVEEGDPESGGPLPSPGNVIDLLSVGRLMNSQISFGLQNLVTIFQQLPFVDNLEDALSQGSGSNLDTNEEGQGVLGVGSLGLGKVLSSVTNLLPTFGLSSLSNLLPGIGGSDVGRGRLELLKPFSYFSRLPFSNILGMGHGRTAGGQAVSGSNTSILLTDENEPQVRRGKILVQQALNQSLALNADIDALTSLFSSGHEVPFVGTLRHLHEASQELAAHPNGLSEWITFKGALNQMYNDVKTLGVAYNLTGTQSSAVSDMLEEITALSNEIEAHTGDISKEFITSISDGLDKLGKDVLQLNGTRLTPYITVGGMSLSSRVPDWDKHAGYTLDFHDMDWLHDRFGLTGSVLLGLVTMPLDIGGSVATDLFNLASRVRLTDLISWGVGGIPSLLSQALHLTRIFDYLTTTMGSSLNVAHGFSEDPNSTLNAVLSDQVGSTKGSVYGLAKILYLESGKQHLADLQKTLKEEGDLLKRSPLLPDLQGSRRPAARHLAGKEETSPVDGDLSKHGADLEEAIEKVFNITTQIGSHLHKQCHVGETDKNATAARAALILGSPEDTLTALNATHYDFTPEDVAAELTTDMEPVDLSGDFVLEFFLNDTNLECSGQLTSLVQTLNGLFDMCDSLADILDTFDPSTPQIEMTATPSSKTSTSTVSTNTQETIPQTDGTRNLESSRVTRMLKTAASTEATESVPPPPAVTL